MLLRSGCRGLQPSRSQPAQARSTSLAPIRRRGAAPCPARRQRRSTALPSSSRGPEQQQGGRKPDGEQPGEEPNDEKKPKVAAIQRLWQQMIASFSRLLSPLLSGLSEERRRWVLVSLRFAAVSFLVAALGRHAVAQRTRATPVEVGRDAHPCLCQQHGGRAALAALGHSCL